MKDRRGYRGFEDWVLPRDGGSRAEATEDKFLLMGLDDASNRGGERVVGTDGAPRRSLEGCLRSIVETGTALEG